MIVLPPETRGAVAAGLAFVAACLAFGLALRLAAEAVLVAAVALGGAR